MPDFDLAGFFYQLSFMALPIVVAITFHEAAHGWMALRLGDDTASRQGRVSFNPVRHIDPVGTILLPLILFYLTGMLFGWARPVPVDFSRLHNPRRDMVWVAVVGPGTNIILAFLSALLVPVATLIPGQTGAWVHENLQFSMFINVLLAVFNMLPIPPLDGGRICVGILADRIARPLSRLENYGIPLILGVFLLLPTAFAQFGVRFDPYGWIILPPTFAIRDGIADLVGIWA